MFENIEKLKYNIDYQFNDMKLLKEALTHRSYATERRLRYDNQRLEYFGDSVIQIIVSEYLYHRYPKQKEGFLTKTRSSLVKKEALADLARDIDLGSFIFFGRGEMLSEAADRDSALADAFEALVGAMFIDSNGIDKPKAFCLYLIKKIYPDPTKLLPHSNKKGDLQEYIATHNLGDSPEYRVKTTTGPSHLPRYEIEVIVQGKVVGIGIASKKKLAEQKAAKEALRNLSK